MKKYLSLILVALLVTACKEPIETEQVIRPAQVWVAQQQTLQHEVNYSGKIFPANESPLSFRVSGKVIERLVKLGDTVKKGQAIARLDSSDTELNAAQASASLTAAQSEFDASRAQLATMQNNHSVAQSALSTAQSNLVSARSNLSSARSNATAVQASANAAKSNIRVAQSELENAQQEYHRTHKLFQQNFISKTVLDRDTQRLRTAQANVKAAQSQWHAAQSQVKAAQGEVGAAQGNVSALESQIDAAQAQVKAAKSQVDIAQSQMQAAKAQIGAVGAQTRLANNQNRYTVLKSPYSGVVTQTQVEVGQVVSAGQAVITLAKQDGFEVHIHVGEQAIQAMRVGEAVEVALWVDQDKRYSGIITEIAPSAGNSRTWLVKAMLQESNEQFKLGMTAQIYLAQSTHNNSIWLPASAVYQDQQKTAVWVVDTENKVSLRSIEVLKYLDIGVLVKGLSEGETIIAAGVHHLLQDEVILPIPYTGRAVPRKS